MKIKNKIPNFLTLMNLLCGCIAITMEFQGRYLIVVVLIFIAAFFDFCDGFLARLLKVKSDIGKDLDSLSDMVSFGVLPGIILFNMINKSYIIPNYSIININPIPYVAFMIPLMSAVRLAKFNNDARQSECFSGLPTPANTLFIVSLSMILLQLNNNSQFFMYNYFIEIVTNYKILIIIAVILSFLLVIPTPLISLKFKKSSKIDNIARILFLFLSIILILLFKWASSLLILLLYYFVSLICFFIKKKTLNSLN